MLDKSFAKWWLSRIEPFIDVPAEKLTAEREAVQKQSEYNQHYHEFLNTAVLPGVESLVQMLAKNRVVHRVSTWGNQLALRVHLAWRWGELVIMQSHEERGRPQPSIRPARPAPRRRGRTRAAVFPQPPRPGPCRRRARP